MAKASKLTGQLVYQYRDDSAPEAGDIFFSMKTSRTGCYIADGADYSQTDDAELFAAIGSTFNTQINPTTGSAWAAPSAGRFRVPDMRGVVPRGAGTPVNGVALAVGAYEADQLQGHKHNLVLGYGAASGDRPALTTNGASSTNDSVSGGAGAIVTDGTNGTPRTGGETRVKARGGNWYIRRFNPTPQVIGAGQATSTSLGLVSGGKVPGSISGTAIEAGKLGETIYASLSNTAFGATGVAFNFGTLPLTKGEWMVYLKYASGTSGTPQTVQEASISLTSGTPHLLSTMRDTSNASVGRYSPTTARRISLAADQNIYAVMSVTYVGAASTTDATGSQFYAVRVG